MMKKNFNKRNDGSSKVENLSKYQSFNFVSEILFDLFSPSCLFFFFEKFVTLITMDLKHL